MKVTRQLFIRGVATIAVLASVRAAGQRTNRLPRAAIVFITPATDIAGTDPYLRAFVDALRELGLVDGDNIIIERRSADRQPELGAVMEELVARNVDVIVTGGPVRGPRSAPRTASRSSPWSTMHLSPVLSPAWHVPAAT